MKLAKSLLLGAAAGFAGVAAASAADLPSRTKGPAVEYVRICDTYGTGFYYIPGTDTCLKVFGQVRAEYRFGTVGKSTFTTTGAANGNLVRAGTTNAAGVLGLNDTNNITATTRSKDADVFFSRASIRLDARTQTAYGVLRSFGAVDFNTANATGGLGIDKAFIQWAGITAGYAQSNFDFYADDAGFSGVRTSDNTVNMLAYTAVFGGGFSATLSIEDPRARRYGIVNVTGANAIGAGYAGNRVPDVVGNLRIDQTWGSAQLSAVAHQLVTQNSSLVASTTRSRDTYGYAVQAGVKINLPFLGAKDAFFLQGAYGNGASAYVLEGAGSTAAGNTNGAFPGGITQVHGDAVALPCFGVGCTGYRLSKERSYSVVAALEHYWTPTIRQDIYGSYARVTPGGAAKAGDWRQGYLGNWREYRIATTLYWFPVAGLTIGVDGIYARVNQTLAAAPGFLPTSRTIGGTTYKKDYDSFSGRLRINRAF